MRIIIKCLDVQRPDGYKTNNRDYKKLFSLKRKPRFEFGVIRITETR